MLLLSGLSEPRPLSPSKTKPQKSSRSKFHPFLYFPFLDHNCTLLAYEPGAKRRKAGSPVRKDVPQFAL